MQLPIKPVSFHLCYSKLVLTVTMTCRTILSEIFKKVLELFEEYGIKIENSRIDGYKKDLSVIVDSFPFKSVTKAELSEKLEKHCNTLFEVSLLKGTFPFI